jgi:DNA modification methylase
MIDTIICGDCLEVMREMPDECVQTCITSPPYWGLRDYGLEPVVWDWGKADAWLGCLGLEPTPELYVDHLVQIFREVRRLLRKDGTLWLNIGDSYAGGNRGGNPEDSPFRKQATNKGSLVPPTPIPPGSSLKPKDMVLIPFRLALALQADGWWIRSDIIWHKPNCMPSSVKDRPTTDFEHVFLLAKNKKYYYDADAIREPIADKWQDSHYKYMNGNIDNYKDGSRHSAGIHGSVDPQGRNKRTIWTIPTRPYPEAHFATFPPDLIVPMILAGSAEGDTVLDPFGGSGTVAEVALKLGRHFVIIETNQDYCDLAHERIAAEQAQLKLDI